MDIVFKAAVRCGHRYGPDDHYGKRDCGKEAEFEELMIDRTATAEFFAVLAEREFQKQGWLIDGKTCRCPDHN